MTSAIGPTPGLTKLPIAKPLPIPASLNPRSSHYALTFGSDQITFAGRKRPQHVSTQTDEQDDDSSETEKPKRNDSSGNGPKKGPGPLKAFKDDYPDLYKQAKQNIQQTNQVSQEDVIQAGVDAGVQRILSDLDLHFNHKPGWKQWAIPNMLQPKIDIPPKTKNIDSAFEPDIATLQKRIQKDLEKKLAQARHPIYLKIKQGQKISGYRDPAASADAHVRSLKQHISYNIAAEAVQHSENPLLDECHRLKVEATKNSQYLKRLDTGKTVGLIGSGLALGTFGAFQPRAGWILTPTKFVAQNLGKLLINWTPGLNRLPALMAPLSKGATLVGKIPGIEKLLGLSSIPIGWPLVALGGILAVKGIANTQTVRQAFDLDDADNVGQIGKKVLKTMDGMALNIPSTTYNATTEVAKMTGHGIKLLHPANIQAGIQSGQDAVSAINGALFGLPGKTLRLPLTLWENRPQLSYFRKSNNSQDVKSKPKAEQAVSKAKTEDSQPERASVKSGQSNAQTPVSKEKDQAIQASDIQVSPAEKPKPQPAPPVKTEQPKQPEHKQNISAFSSEESQATIQPNDTSNEKPKLKEEPEPVVIDKPVKQAAPVQPIPIVEEVTEEEPQEPTQKPDEKPVLPESSFEKYAWPAVHVTAGSSLIAGGALLQLPVITAPVGWGLIGVGSLWAGYGLYRAYEQYSTPPAQA